MMIKTTSLLCAIVARDAFACTNILVPSGSSVDGSTLIGYNADGAAFYGAVSHWPATDHSPGELRPIWSWDDAVYLGAIPEVPHTYNVVGNTNEHQLTIGESTFGGLIQLTENPVCNQTYGCMDYGQLEWVTLARSRTAREAIHMIDSLMQTYGYASTGESFSIADPKEVWLMEIIGKGPHGQGAVWVATKIPDGYVCAHANQARTRHFVPNEPDRFLHSADVVDFARSIGLYTGTDENFSFADAFDPFDAESARFCEARVWSFFRQVAADEEKMESYLDHVRGFELERFMPLYVKVKQKLSVDEVLWFMRNKLEDTYFDQAVDVGAGQWHTPERLAHECEQWQQNGVNYANNRPIGVPYTGWGFVATQRPEQRYSVMWFGVHDASFSPRVPFYGATSRVPRAWEDGNCTQMDWCRKERGYTGRVTDFSFQSMWWVNRMVANLAYAQYNQVAPVVKAKLQEFESAMQAEVAEMDAKLLSMSDVEAAEAATSFSFDKAERAHEEWQNFYGQLFTMHADGYTTVENPSDPASGCDTSYPEMDKMWMQEVAEKTGDKYKMPDSGFDEQTMLKRSKRSLPSVSGRYAKRGSVDSIV